jgi:hypothetical protein
MVNRRGIYKDVYGTPKDREWSDYQVSGVHLHLHRHFSPIYHIYH